MKVRTFLKGLAIVVAVGIAGLGTMQVVPYGRAHTNPVVVQEPAWDMPRTRELAKRACFDCHSNETRWPGYSHVAPVSWTLQHDVNVGRSVLNFSEWNEPWELAPESGATVLRREMPPRSYRMMHPEARLSDGETEELARGLDATFGTSDTVAGR
jgi:mono/diheme cytochrome c family protein